MIDCFNSWVWAFWSNFQKGIFLKFIAAKNTPELVGFPSYFQDFLESIVLALSSMSFDRFFFVNKDTSWHIILSSG